MRKFKTQRENKDRFVSFKEPLIKVEGAESVTNKLLKMNNLSEEDSFLGTDREEEFTLEEEENSHFIKTTPQLKEGRRP